MYELVGVNPDYSLRFNNSFIPLDLYNMDFFNYARKVHNNEIEDVLPAGLLDQMITDFEAKNGPIIW